MTQTTDSDSVSQFNPRNLIVRAELNEKICFPFQNSLQDILTILEQADNLMKALQYYAIGTATRDGLHSDDMKSVTIRPHQHNISNSCAVIESVFDDFTAAFHCLTHGFFKQAQAILRGTVESIVQFVLLLKNSDLESYIDQWTTNQRGMIDFRKTLEQVKDVTVMQESDRWLRLRNAYNLTCEATHGKKNRMHNRGFASGDSPTHPDQYNLIDAYLTISLFVFLLDTEIPIVRATFAPRDDIDSLTSAFFNNIHASLDNIQSSLHKFHQSIELFAKGYLIQNEKIVMPSGKQILYSVKLDGQCQFRGKRKPKLTGDESWALTKKINQRLFQDIY